jgi:hypothetical protein
MKAFFVKEIKDDGFFFIVAFGSYLTGSFLSKAAVKNWDFVAFFCRNYFILCYAYSSTLFTDAWQQKQIKTVQKRRFKP